jgi:endonuclease YncB( thermonuclease family)
MLPSKILSLFCMTYGIGCSAFAAEVSVISGDTFFAKGRAVKVFGIQCPTTETEEGLQAKRIANTYLSGSRVKCAIKQSKTGQLVGDCKLRANNGRALSEVLLATGLCRSTSGNDL